MKPTIDLAGIAADIGPGFAENAAKLDASDGFVGANFDVLRAHKVYSALIPQEYGGGGAGYSDMCEFVRQIAGYCSSTGLALSMHQHLVAAAVANDKAGRPGRALLDKVAGAEAILVSTGANDWLESSGSATKVEGGYEISAFKPFASGSPKGDVAVTSAAYDDPDEGPKVLHFPVPLNAKGVSLMDDWRTMGMRSTGSQSIKLDKVFVPDAAVGLIRPRGGFFPGLSVVIAVALPMVMSAYIGVAEAAAAIARERSRSKADDPVTPFLIGEMENLLMTAQVMHEDMLRLVNDFEFTPSVELASHVLSRKTVCANNVIACCHKALEATGGAGYFRKLGLERLLRDVMASQFHPLPERKQQQFTGRLSMGLEAVASS